MGGVSVSREEVGALVREAHNTGQNKEAFVRAQLQERYPGIENLTIRRAGQVYSVLDYLAQDLESYATS